MTSIPYDLFAMNRTVSPVLESLRAAFGKQTYRTRLSFHAAKLPLDTEATIWYYKGTPVEIVYTRSMGFVLLDHVRKLRSPGLNSLMDAIRARANTLKEHANVQPAEVDAASGDHETADRAPA